SDSLPTAHPLRTARGGTPATLCEATASPRGPGGRVTTRADIQLPDVSSNCIVVLNREGNMKRDRRLPLTETVFYILMCLIEPAHGYLIMSRVEEASEGQVRLAPGTLYGALENLSKQGLI